MTCPICRKPYLRREEYARLTWYEHEASDVKGQPARWAGCVELRPRQKEMVV